MACSMRSFTLKNDIHTPMTQTISKKDIRFIMKAADIANNSKMLMRHGCVIVENNHIIATGYNNYRTRFGDRFVENSCSCHAEMHALRNALKIKAKKNSFKQHKQQQQRMTNSHVRKRVGQRSQCEKGASVQTIQII
jgi:deoxycytidylate deaminase